MHRHHRRRESTPEPRLQLSRTFPRFVASFIAALSVISAGVYVFGPFSDLSALQLATGPDNATAAPVLARSEPSWSAAAHARQAASAPVPIARLARRDTRGP